MKAIKALRALFRRLRMNDEEMQAAIDRSVERQWRARLPEAPGVMRKYLSFTGRYELEHPGVTPMEAHEACMRAHPEYWPRTLPNGIYEPEPAYSP